MWQISACAWVLPRSPNHSPTSQIDRIRDAGFASVDLRPDCWSGLDDAAQLATRGLTLGCAGLMPEVTAPGISVELLGSREFNKFLPYILGSLERAATLGAQRAYMTTPPRRLSDTTHFARALNRLADAAAENGIMLCVEPHPGGALSTSFEALAFVQDLGHENLYVLLDLGHCLITGEDPSEAVKSAGKRLGYVHIDDNDGLSDQHRPLFDGILTRSTATSLLHTLKTVGYDGPIGIELSKSTASPITALVQARDFVESWNRRYTPKYATLEKSE